MSTYRVHGSWTSVYLQRASEIVREHIISCESYHYYKSRVSKWTPLSNKQTSELYCHYYQWFIKLPYIITRATLPRYAVAQCGCMDEEYQCSRKVRFRLYYQWLFLQVPLSLTPPLRVLEVHINDIMGITIHITESNIHISYTKNHDSTLMLSSCLVHFHNFSFWCY